MMAHDESLGPEPRALTPETRDRLRDTEAELRSAVAAVAAEAHARDLRAEALVIAFKAVIEELAERDAGPSGPNARAFQSRLVTLCIKAYYGA
jgi:hypothetical protein